MRSCFITIVPAIAVTFVSACAPSAERQLEEHLETLHGRGNIAESVSLSLGDIPAFSYDYALKEWESVRHGYTTVLAQHPQNEEARARLITVNKQIEVLQAEREYGSFIG